MLSQVFLAVFLASLAGGSLTLLLVLIKPITKRCFSSNWHYYIWLTVLVVLLLPVRFRLPAIIPAESNLPAIGVQTQQQGTEPKATEPITTADTALPPKPFSTFVSVKGAVTGQLPLISLLWLVGAAVLLAGKSAAYFLLLYKIRRTTKIVPCPELKKFTDKAVTVRAGGGFHAPFLIGLLRPTLILPQIPMTQEQKNNILRHEMMHLSRRDLYYKWLAFVAGCLHWFNPAVYYVTKQINEACEISCDLAVTDTMNAEEKKSYMDTILTVLSCKKGQNAFLCTGMASGKKQIERRFFMIQNRKVTSKLMSSLSVAVALALLSTTVFASGVLSGLTENNDTIEVTNNGKKIELVNKPFIENGELYLPLRETLEKIGVMDNTGSYISWNNGKIEVFFGYDDNGAAVKMDDRFEMEIGKTYLFYNPSNDLPNSDALRDMYYAPLLAGQTTYVPYSFISCMFAESEWDINYTVYDREASTHIFNMRVKITNSDDSIVYDSETLKYPQSVITSFFDAFSKGEFTIMKNYCTEKCIQDFFGDGYVFGMTQASLVGLYIDPLEYAKSSNDFVVQVGVEMQPAPNSVYLPEQTATSFYLILLRQEDGSYRIDEFATGL